VPGTEEEKVKIWNWNSDIRIEKNKKYLEKLAMFQFGVAT
jgi:hypothetical protein